jgi:GTP-binding protein
MHHSFLGYGPKGSDPVQRPQGVLVCKTRGRSTGYALFNLQERGTLLIGPGVEVYEGMIMGLSSRGKDLVVNPAKAKALTNMRSKASDEAIVLTPPLEMTLEQALEFIDDSELVEITPKSLRLRKKILNASLRKRTYRKDEEIEEV